MTRIALAGVGSMGKTHANAYTTIPDAAVVAVVGRTLETAQSVASMVGARPYTSLKDALAENEIDVVDCCLPTDLHRAAVEEAAAHHCQVICEKPLALTLDDARAMIAACRQAGVHLLMAQVVRFFPEYRRLEAEVRAGRVGTPATCTLLRQGLYPIGRDRWFRDEERSGGIFLDMMIHDFDWALQRFGPAERVYARLIRRGGEYPFAQGMATVRHRSGVISLITGTWGFPGPFNTAVEIAGDGGLLQYRRDDAQPVRFLGGQVYQGTGDIPMPDLSAGEDPYRTELAHFIDVLNGRAEPLVQPEESLAALELACAARTSADTGRPHLLNDEEVRS